jgi:protein ImuB
VTAARPGPPRVLVVWCPHWREDDPAGPASRAFDQVVAAVEEVCPHVEVLRPGECVIDARGPARYFGGERALAAKIEAAVADLGFACQTGVADGLFAAGLAARDGGTIVAPGQTPAFLAPQPVSVLEDAVLAGLLPRLGIRTLGEFAALPPADAAGRFGAEGEIAHRLARGEQARPVIGGPPPADLSVSHEFDPPAELAEPVVFTAKTLAERLHEGLAARGLACARLQVTAVCASGREITRLWRHDGLLSAQAVAQRVHWQLDGWQHSLPQSAAGPDDGPDGICLLRLAPDQLTPGHGRQLALWGEAPASDLVAQAALRVQAMLGHEAVLQPVLSGGRDPAEQVTFVPFGDDRNPALPAGRPWPGRMPAPAPATVYPAPLPATVTDQAGTAVSVTGRAAMSAEPAWLSVQGGPPEPVTAWAGPWPLTQRWWSPDGQSRKARFQLVAGDEIAWLAVIQDGRWLIEASYD